MSVVTEDKKQTEVCGFIKTKEIIQTVSTFYKCIASTLLLSISFSISTLIIIHNQNETICVNCLLECLVHGKCSINISLWLFT